MASLQGWAEGILISLLFVSVLTATIVELNVQYGKSYIVPFSDKSGAENLFIEYQDTAETQISGGEVAFDSSQGITLKSSWGLIKDVTSVIWNFITGGWISDIISYLNLGIVGTALALFMRVLFFISVIFSIVYILFKVVP